MAKFFSMCRNKYRPTKHAVYSNVGRTLVRQYEMVEDYPRLVNINIVYISH